MAGRIVIHVDLTRFGLSQIRARQIVDGKLDLREFRQGSGVQAGDSPAGNRRRNNRLEIGFLFTVASPAASATDGSPEMIGVWRLSWAEVVIGSAAMAARLARSEAIRGAGKMPGAASSAILPEAASLGLSTTSAKMFVVLVTVPI